MSYPMHCRVHSSGGMLGMGTVVTEWATAARIGARGVRLGWVFGMTGSASGLVIGTFGSGADSLHSSREIRIAGFPVRARMVVRS